MVNYTSKTPVYRGDGKPIGYIEGDTLFKSVSSEKHMLKKPRGWAWDTDILDQAEKQGAVRIEIHEKLSRKTYHARIQDYWDNGIGFNRGFGDQIVLPLQYWDIRNPGEPPTQQLALAF